MSKKQDLLFELGCEELPPTSLLKLSNALTEQVTQGLQAAGLEFGAVHPYATPRRLSLWIESVSTHQPDQLVEKRGPAIKAAYQEDGTPSKATLGFMHGCGPDVQLDQLQTLKTDKGEWLMFRQSVAGQPATQLLPDILNRSLAALPIAKRMRWGNRDDEFVRPVHWVVLMLGNSIVHTKILGVPTGDVSWGHRFHANQTIQISNPSQYAELLHSQGRVMVNFNQRQDLIRQIADDAAKAVHGQAHIEADLLEEVTALVEWPVAVTGKIDQQYLALPKEALITTMQSNQKYFPVLDQDGELLPYFITISNIESSRPKSVQEGNERVVRPRLSDAEFFWQQDRKQSLEDRVGLLDKIVFQHKLGTLRDKTRRVEFMADFLAKALGGDPVLAIRAALLSKTDLLTNMVGEFASLQGIMGRYYAEADQEPAEVALAIEEHYYPKQAGAALPSSKTGDIVALADKIDTIVGIFSAGLIPSGDKDPYALRRAALGLIRILVEHQLDLDVEQMVHASIQQFSHVFDQQDTQTKVLNFITERFRGYSQSRGYTAEQFEAVLRVAPLRPAEFDLRLQAVQEFMRLPEADSLCAANKRIQNLLRKSGVTQLNGSDQNLLTEPAEKQLLAALESVNHQITPKIADREYTSALRDLSKLETPVNQFFEDILVMSDNPNLRDARLSLLQSLHNNFIKIADISVI